MREGEKHLCERETSIGCSSYMPQLGTRPATKVCALTGNRTRDLLVYGTTLQLAEPHHAGPHVVFICAHSSLVCLCVSKSFSQKNSSQIGLVPTLMVNLNISLKAFLHMHYSRIFR